MTIQQEAPFPIASELKFLTTKFKVLFAHVKFRASINEHVWLYFNQTEDLEFLNSPELPLLIEAAFPSLGKRVRFLLPTEPIMTNSERAS